MTPERRGPDVPDGFDLRPDGTILLHVDNERWKMRRPKLGEFRKLRELLHERDDERLRIIAGLNPSPDSPGDDADQAEKLAYTLAVSARGRELADQVTELNVSWLVAALGMLCDHDPPQPDDWPSGMDSSDTIAALVQHWRAVPLRSGGS